MKHNNPYVLVANTIVGMLLAILGWHSDHVFIDQALLVLSGMYISLVLWHASEMRRREEKRRIEEADDGESK